MTGEVFTAWSLFTGGEEEGAGGCCRGWAATVRSQEGRRSSVLVSRRRSGVALQHNTGNTRYIYTLYLSSHLIHCLDILTTIYHCIFTLPMLPTTVPGYKCGPVSSARGNFPHCLRSRYPTILTIAVLPPLGGSSLTHLSALLSSPGGHWPPDTPADNPPPLPLYTDTVCNLGHY